MAAPGFSDLLKEARARLQALDAQIAEARKKEDTGQRLDKLQRELAELSTRLTTLETQAEGLGRAVETLQKTGGAVPPDLRARLDRMEGAIADLSRRTTGEKDALIAYRQSVKRLVEATGRPEEMVAMRKVLEAHLASFPEREARVKGLEARMERLQTLEARLTDLDAALRKDSAGFETRLQAVSKVGEELERMKAGVIQEMGSNQARLEEVRERMDRFDAQIREVPALVKKEVEGALVGAVGDLWTKIKSLEGEVSKVESAFQGMRAEVARVREVSERAASSTPAEIERLVARAQSIEERLAEAQRSVPPELEGRLRRMEEELRVLDERAGAAEGWRQELSRLRAELLEEAGASGKVREEVRRVAEAQQRAEQGWRSQLADLKGQLQTALSVEARLQEVERRIGGEKDLLATYRNAAKRLSEEMGGLKSKDIETLKKVLEERMVQIPQMEARVRGLEGAVEEIRTVVRQAGGASMKPLESALGALERRLQETDGRWREVREEVDRLSAALREAEGGAKAGLDEVKRQVQSALALEVRLRELEGKIGGERDLLSAYRSAAKRLVDEMGGLKRRDIEGIQRALEERLKGLEAELREVSRRAADPGARVGAVESALKELERRVREAEERLRAAPAPAGPTAQDLRRQRQSIVALLDTLRSGYEQRLLPREEFEAIERENRQKIAELDQRIAQLEGT